MRSQTQPGKTLLDLLEEQSATPAMCAHGPGPRSPGKYGYVLEQDRSSRFFGRWVHSDPDCRRPSHMLGEPQV